MATLTRAVSTLAAVVTAVFLLTAALPQDAAQVLAGRQADPTRLAALRAELGLDRPWWSRFFSWLAGLLHGDLGRSYVDGRPVGPVLAERLGASALIVVPAWLLAVVSGVVVALVVARRAAGSAAVAAFAALPEVVLVSGLVLVFATGLRLLPAVSLVPVGGSAWDAPEVLVLPVLGLALPSAAWLARSVRGPVTDVLRRPFVVDAHLRGVSPVRVVVRHVLPHLAAPVAQGAAILAGALLAGTTVVESLLAYPGLGRLLATAVAGRDVPVVQAVALVDAVVVLGAVLVADRVAKAGAR
ncbi:ABC transporter permease [Amycolatopsis kentuckyensis]|uniref:ABC transporter permease n=1 Tax=Amycolatopsis kentuckyensis TaxID=218823 RepID=UPI0013024F60|nr:ABC transporter permease [Amycolatopsis kentuckyensis]